ncbi:MAG: type II secretion system secretin GspD [Candidatus Tectomicrobia bacterium]|nr:type II secretion system secretin GspD [Candidatus Tectomicrobia bacterium]
MVRWNVLSIVGGLLFALLLHSSGAYGARADLERRIPAASPRSDSLVAIDFDDVDIKVVVKFMSEITGKNFLMDDKVRGKITIISPTKIPLDDAYQVLLSILEVQGFRAVPSGQLVKIVPARDVKEKAVETEVGRDQASTEDRIVTQLIPLNFADANELRTLLTPLVSRDSSLIAYPPTNTLILTEVASNINRLITIIKEIDVKSIEEQINVIQLQNASAPDLANTLLAAVEGGDRRTGVTRGGIAPRRAAQRPAQPGAVVAQPAPVPLEGVEKVLKIIPDARTNSLVIIASPEDTQLLKSLIEKLDVEAPPTKGQIHVYYLKNAVASELAQVLAGQASRLPARREPTQPQRGLGGRTQTGLGATTPGTLGGLATQIPSTTPQPGTGPISATTPSGITITADQATNSLVITASPEEYKALIEVIEKLDIKRPQVYIEAAILEMTLNKAKSVGVEFRSISNNLSRDRTTVIAGTNLGGQIGTATTNPLGLAGFVLGAVDGTITLGGQTFLNVAALVQAVQDDTEVNVLSTPYLLTTDNQEAEIVVARTVPFVTSESQTEVSNIRRIERIDVGLILRVTPQITQSDNVKLNIFQELSSIEETVTPNAVQNVGPTTSRRTAKTSVVVKDNQTVMISGLIRDDANLRQTKTPCIGDVPVFGWAFKLQSNRNNKTNLLVLLTPHIVRTDDELGDTSSRLREKIQNPEGENGKRLESPQSAPPFQQQ